MSKSGGSQTVRQELDPATREHMRRVYGAASAAGQQPYTPYGGQSVAGVSPLAPEATERYRRAADFGMTGMGAMAGDQDAIGRMMNPYLGTMDPMFDRLRTQATMSANDQATQAGAFGGSRHGVLQAERLGGIDRAQAEMNYGAFNDAMQRAAQLGSFGMGANAAQMGAADYYRNIQQQQLSDQERRFNEARDWDVRNLGVMQGAMGGPHGQTTSQDMSRNPLAGALGGAAAGSMFGLPGMIGGGLLGGFGLI